MALTKNFNIDENALLTEGFVNDKTPLDADNLNTLIDGINDNRKSIKSLNDGYATDEELSQEVTDRTNADMRLQQMIWGSQPPPSDGDYIKRQLDEVDNKRQINDTSICKAAFGTDTPPSTINDGGTDTSKHSLKKKIDTLNATKANINGAILSNPEFTGEVYAPTLDKSTKDSRVATASFVHNVVDDAINNLDIEDINLSNYYTKTEVDDKIEDIVIEGGGVSQEWVEDYVSENACAIVYLNTKQHVGRNIELQDVYPIQAEDTSLKIISKNRVTYETPSQSISGIIIKTTPEEGIKVTGSVTNVINDYFVVSEVDVDVPGKYVLSVQDNDGVENENKKCYIAYTLHSSRETGYEIIRGYTRLTTGSNAIINTKELGCSHIRLYVFIYATTGQTFNTTASQTFKVQIEHGDKATNYTPPKDESNIAYKQIEIYGKNLCKDDGAFDIPYDSTIMINGNSVQDSNDLGTHYITGVLTADNVVEFKYGDNIKEIHTPLLMGDKFTFIYNVTYKDVNIININNLQIVYGYTDYEDYHKPLTLYTQSLDDGTCDIVNIQYPYSFLSLKHTDEYPTDGYTICLSYDPALSRSWTEKQLSDLNKRIDTLESIIKSLTN